MVQKMNEVKKRYEKAMNKFGELGIALWNFSNFIRRR